jgi:hypothetical protein
MSSYLLYCDFLSPAPNLNIDKHSHFRSNLGAVFSMIVIFLIIAITSYFTIRMFDREDQSVIFNQIASMKVAQNLSDYPFMIMLQGYLIYDRLTPRDYYLYSTLWRITKNTTTGQMQTTRTLIEYEMCDINKHFGQYKEYFENVTYMKSHFCPVPGRNNLSLYGIYGSDDDYSFISHNICRCVNNSALNGNRTDCNTREELDINLKETYLSYKFLEFSIDHSDLNNPGKINFRSEAIPLSSSIFRRIWFSVRPITYITDLGYIFQEDFTQEYYQVSGYRESVDLRTEGSVPGSFSSITVYMDTKYDSYRRTYTKVQNLLANIGGIIKALFTAAQICTLVINTQMYYYDLVKSLFIIDKDKDETKGFTLQSSVELSSINPNVFTYTKITPIANNNNLNLNNNKNIVKIHSQEPPK